MHTETARTSDAVGPRPRLPIGQRLAAGLLSLALGLGLGLGWPGLPPGAANGPAPISTYGDSPGGGGGGGG